MNTRYIVQIKDEEGLTISEVSASSIEHAKAQFENSALYNKFYIDKTISYEWLVTLDEHRVTYLRELPKGHYFVKVDRILNENKRVYVKDSYDFSSKKYICCKFYDMCDSILVSGSQYVTDEMTF